MEYNTLDYCFNKKSILRFILVGLLLFVSIIDSFSQTITSFSPVSQLATKNVVITGTGFTTTTAVRFGGVNASSFTVNSASQITAVVPTTAQTGEVSVVTGSGTATRSGFIFIETIDRIYTDFSGYWTSGTSSLNTTFPDLSHNLLGFKYGNTIYSTSVSDSTLTANSVTHTTSAWNAFPVNTLSGTGSSAVLLYASKNDGTNATAINPNKKIKDVLIDGKRGLDIGTGIANFTNQIEFTVTNISSSKISDSEPDIIITQVADPSTGSIDKFWFKDASGNRVGNELSAIATDLPVLGTYYLDLWNLNSASNSTISNNDAVSNAVFNNGNYSTRPIRLFAYKLSDFGIDANNYSNCKTLVFQPGGVADYAFVAYNSNTFVIPTASVSSQPVSTTTCAGAGTSATFSVSASNPTSVGASGGTITYQWKKNGNNLSNGGNITGATSSTLVISSISSSDFGEYVCEITNNFGSILSDPAYLNVRISAEPVSGQMCINTTPTALSVNALGNAPSYQWFTNSSNSLTNATIISGATSSSYVPPVNSTGTKYYFCIVSDPNASGCTISDTSAVVSMQVDAESVGGTISGSQTVCYGTNSATLTLSGRTGTVQKWQYSTASNFSSPIDVANTSATQSVSNLIATRYYRAVVKNGACLIANSTTGTITVNNTYTWEGNTSTAYNTSSNWVEGCIPHTGADISFKTSSNPTRKCELDVDPVLGNITISGNTASHIFDLNNRSLTVRGTLTLSNNNLDATDGNSTLVFGGSTAQSLPASSLVNNEIAKLTINNSAGVTLQGTTNLTRLLTLSAGTLNTNSHLTFKSNANYTAQLASVPASGTSINGNVTVEKYIPAKRSFRFIGSTVNTTTSIHQNWQENGSNWTDDPNPGFGTHITGSKSGANGLDATLSGNPSLFTYSNTTQTWSSILNTNSAALSVGTPYRLMIRGSRSVNIYQGDNIPTPTNTTLRAIGTLHTGSYSYNNLSATPNADNFIVNPYQCAVDLSQILTSGNTNLAYNNVWVWDPFINSRGSYVLVEVSSNTVTPSGSTANKYLQPGQGFFIKTSSNATAAPSITFTEASKYTSGTFATSSLMEIPGVNTDRINITLINLDSNVIADATALRFSPTHSDSITDLDAKKIKNLDEMIGINQNGQLLALNCVNIPKNQQKFPLNITQYRAQNYELRIQTLGLKNQNLELFDFATNNSMPIQAGQEFIYQYNTNIPQGNKADRFEIRVTPNDQVDPVHNHTNSAELLTNWKQVRLAPNPIQNSEIRLVNLPTSSELTQIELRDLNGKSIQAWTEFKKLQSRSNELTLEIQKSLPAGLYFIELHHKKGNIVLPLNVE
jgi:hypothetical protein